MTKASGTTAGKVDPEAPAVHQLSGWLPAVGDSPTGDELAASELGVAAQAAREDIEARLARLAGMTIGDGDGEGE